MGKTTIDFTFEDNSEAVIEEIMNLTKDALKSSAEIIVKETKRKIKGYTGQLADGVMAQDDDEISMASDMSNASIELGYLTQSSFKKNVRKGTFYPNPYWIEFGTGSHIIQTKELKRADENTQLSYQLTDLQGNKYGYEVTNPGTRQHNYLRDSEFLKFKEVADNLTNKIGEIENAELNAMKTKKINYKKEWF